mmetsp:Transcript_5229/g.15424  ORF Transcript_5229/g.15424 Transcript_5229/m.15424 type:complete len:241 (+) Transcript_5229:336-1058(+)
MRRRLLSRPLRQCRWSTRLPAPSAAQRAADLRRWPGEQGPLAGSRPAEAPRAKPGLAQATGVQGSRLSRCAPGAPRRSVREPRALSARLPDPCPELPAEPRGLQLRPELPLSAGPQGRSWRPPDRPPLSARKTPLGLPGLPSSMRGLRRPRPHPVEQGRQWGCPGSGQPQPHTTLQCSYEQRAAAAHPGPFHRLWGGRPVPVSRRPCSPPPTGSNNHERMLQRHVNMEAGLLPPCQRGAN